LPERYLQDNLRPWGLTAEGTWVRRQPRDGAPAVDVQAVLLEREAGASPTTAG